MFLWDLNEFFLKNIYLAKDQCIDSGFRDWMAELAPEVQIL
jgi:hypothetical protein